MFRRADRGQGGLDERREWDVVETNHGQLAGDIDPEGPSGSQRSDRNEIVEGDERGELTLAGEEIERGDATVLHAVAAKRDGPQGQAGLLEDDPDAGYAENRRQRRWSTQKGDPAMPEVDQVLRGELPGVDIVKANVRQTRAEAPALPRIEERRDRGRACSFQFEHLHRWIQADNNGGQTDCLGEPGLSYTRGGRDDDSVDPVAKEDLEHVLSANWVSVPARDEHRESLLGRLRLDAGRDFSPVLVSDGWDEEPDRPRDPSDQSARRVIWSIAKLAGGILNAGPGRR